MNRQAPVTGPDVSGASTDEAAASSLHQHGEWLSFLKRLGHVSLEELNSILPFVGRAAEAIEPEFDLLFPLEGPIFNAVVKAIGVVEMASNPMTAEETKMKSVFGLVESTLKTHAANHSFPESQTEAAIQQYIKGLSAIMNGPTRAPASATGTPISATTQPGAQLEQAPTMQPASLGHLLSSTAGTRGVALAGITAPLLKEVVTPDTSQLPEQVLLSGSASQQANADSIIDLSHFNGIVDLAKAADNGISAVIHKATQGLSFVDPKYVTNRQKATASGLLWGAYHFGIGEDGMAQAKHFLQTVAPEPSTVLVLDFEANSHGPSMSLEQARDFILYVYQQTERWPGLYGGYYLKQLLGTASDSILSNCWLWLSQYGNHPTIPRNWKMWTLWQYTDGTFGSHGGPVPGVGVCDRSYFNGKQDELVTRWKRGSLVDR